MSPVLRRLSRMGGLTAAVAALTLSVGLIPSTAATIGGTAHADTTSTCDLSAELVPSCGTLLGAYTTSFGGDNVQQQFLNFNADSGSTLSVGHDYRGPGNVLSGGDVKLAKTPNALLLVNWRPTQTWSLAGGGNATVNAQIDAMAKSVKALGSTKIMMTIYHEPEIALSGGAVGCPSLKYKGSSGTPAQYRAMWANVEARFAALGVTNVVWAVDYTGYSGWNCVINQMWPGNSLVDWILYDPYMFDKVDYAQAVSPFYNFLTANSNATTNYLSKPWGLGEFGDLNDSAAVQDSFYTTVAQSLDTKEFPNLKLLTLYDTTGNLGNTQVDHDTNGTYDAKELANLKVLSNDPSIVQGRASVAGG